MPPRPIQCSLRIIWIMTQVIVNLVSPYTALLQFCTYGSSIDDHQFPYLHPSENPDCQFRVSKREFYDQTFQYQRRFPIDREPSIEIRAILVRCSEPSEEILEERAGMNYINKNETFYENLETSSDREQIQNCRRKLIITLKLNNVGKTRTEEEYIVVSHALDPITMQKSRLQNPYVIKVRQESVLQLYGLKFEKIVNAEAKEQIINNQYVNYTGCNDGIENPTCGLTYENGNLVPFSQGFCCSCHSDVNASRQTMRKLNGSAGNFSSRIEMKDKKRANRSSNRSTTFGNAYEQSCNDSKLSVVAQTDKMERMKEGHLIYSSRRLKQNNVGNNVSKVDNEENNVNNEKINVGKKDMNVDKANIIANNTDINVDNINLYEKNEDRNKSNKLIIKSDLIKDENVEDTTSALIRTILFSPKMQTKGKIEPYIDSIKDQAIRESRNLNDSDNKASINSKSFVDESRIVSDVLNSKNYENRIDDIGKCGRKNLMDELTELEKAYDALKKMRKDKRKNRSTRNVELARNVDKNSKRNGFVDNNIETKTNGFSENPKIENEMYKHTNGKRTEDCFDLRKNDDETRKKEKEDEGKSNSRSSTCLLASSRLKQFPRRSFRTSKKIYEDQSRDIEVPRKMKFTTENVSISSIVETTTTKTKRTTTTTSISNKSETNNVFLDLSSNSTINKSGNSSFDSYENYVFALLTSLLTTDEDISINPNKDIKVINYSFDKNPTIVNKQHNSSNIGANIQDQNKLFIFAQKHSNITILIDRYKRSPGRYERSTNSLGNKSKEKREGISRKRNNFHAKRKNSLSKKSVGSVTEKNLIKIQANPAENKNDTRSIEIFLDNSYNDANDKYIDTTIDFNSTDNPFLKKNNAHGNNIDKIIEEKFDQIKELLKEETSDQSKYMSLEKLKNEITNNNISKDDSNNKDGTTKSNVTEDINEKKCKNDRKQIVIVNMANFADTNVQNFRDNRLPLNKVIPSNKSSFSLNPVNGVEKKSTERAQESRYRTNVEPSAWKARQISDLIISRSRLNSTTVGNPRRNVVSYLDLGDAKIALKKINSSGDRNSALIYQTGDNGKIFTNEQNNIIRGLSRKNLIYDNNNLLKKNVKDDRTSNNEIIFYDYNFDDEDVGDDVNDEYSHDRGRSIRRLLSVDHSNNNNLRVIKPSLEYDEPQNFEYEDYNYQQTSPAKVEDHNNPSNEMIDLDSVTSKHRISMNDELYENVNGDKSIMNADKYIKHMSKVIANRSNLRSKLNKHKVFNDELRIVKKNVNDYPIYSKRDYNFNFDSGRLNDVRKVRTNYDFNMEDANDELNLNQNQMYEDQMENTGRMYQPENNMKYNDRFRPKQSRQSIESVDNDSMNSKQDFGINDQKNDDIDISVNGNIHVEGGINGRPISIAFVAVPDVESDVDTISNDSYFNGQQYNLNDVNDRNDSPFNVESNVISKNNDKYLIITENDHKFNEQNNNNGFSSLESKNNFDDDSYKLEKLHNDQRKPDQKLFIFDPKNSIFNENSVSSIDEENDNYSDYSDDNSELSEIDLTREKKEADSSQMDDDLNYDEKLTSGNITFFRIIPDKPCLPKTNLSNNLDTHSYLSNLYIPFLNISDTNPLETTRNESKPPANVDLTTSIIFTLVIDTTTPESTEKPQDQKECSSETTTVSKITESEILSKKPPIQVLITDLPGTSSQQMINSTTTTTTTVAIPPPPPPPPPSTSPPPPPPPPPLPTTTTMPTTIGDTCFQMKVSPKDTKVNETASTNVPVTVREANSTTIITKLEALLRSSDMASSNLKNQIDNSQMRFKHLAQPEDTPYESNLTDFKTKCDDIDEEKDVTLGPDTRKSIMPALLSSANGTLGNSTSPLGESRSSAIKEKKTRRDTLQDSTSKLLSSIKANSKGPYYKTSFNSDMKEQQQRNYESSKSSVKRSLLRGHENNDKSFLFYPHQNQPQHYSELLSKRYVPNDTDSASSLNKKQRERDKKKKRKINSRNSNDSKFSRRVLRSKMSIETPTIVKREMKKKTRLKSNNKANLESLFKNHASKDSKLVSKKKKHDTRDSNDSESFKDVIGSNTTIEKDLSNLEKEIGTESSHVKCTDKDSFPDLHQQKIGRRKKKKMDDDEDIKKLFDTRRRKKKKKKKRKKAKSQENMFDIPEVKTKWKLTKRNLLSISNIKRNNRIDQSEVLKLIKRNLLTIPKIKRKMEMNGAKVLGVTKKNLSSISKRKKRMVINESKMLRSTKRNLLSIQENMEMDESKPLKTKGEMNKESKSTLVEQKQSKTDGKQVRGGQDCSNRDQSLDVDESKYSESAHCLRFSDLYSVYRLDEPILDQAVSLQLYEKRSLPDGTTRWEDLTRSMIRLDNFARRYRNNDDTLAFTYRATKKLSKEFPATLDVRKNRLLIPSSVSTGKDFKISQSKDAFEEYLIVRASEISKDGNECDKVGVGFKAFVEQPDRCGRLEGTCLKNQPLSYWKHDREAREAGRAGCYFLSNFASVPREAIKYNVSGSGSGEFLALEYHSPHVSAIDIEVRNDYNSVASAGPFGRITHIYVDSTSLIHTIVMIVIRNVGSTPSIYRPRIVNCPQGLPASWSNVKGVVQIILPRQNRKIVFDLYGELPFNEFECTVEVLDRLGKTVATRRMKVRRMDRCFCVWHCLCACVAVADGCRPMSTTNYHAAGFQSPVPNVPMRSSSFDGSFFDIILLLLSILALFLFMGISKWIIGIYIPEVSRWGLDTLLRTTKMSEYFEDDLKCRCIVTDESGFPVHPDTGNRSIRICSRKTEFLLNVIFFLVYPVAVSWHHIQRYISKESGSYSSDESKTCLTSDKDEYENLVTVCTYGDSKNSKMEADDTNYVMNELKKSQESLQEYNRYKRYRCCMEGRNRNRND
ncbi:MATH and LRR domain-containing protein PFE0570w-like [Vespula squamosa]|uniref:MATH and LRR domain-containing protein PFE0570w-like n=1 Tax=Vespula squamosa TaxID=30214 RepID=A0ABD2ATY9_VESSQ